MASFTKFEEIEAWKTAEAIVVLAYGLLKKALAPRTGRLKIRYSALLFLSCAISPRDLRAALTGLSMTCYAEPRALAEKCVR